MIFLDSNVPVYAADATDEVKHRRARDILERAIRSGDFMISAQVINEFSNVALKKLNREPSEVDGLVSVLRLVETVDVKAEFTPVALKIKDRYDVQFYDAVILATALAHGCSEVWSEDMTDGQYYNGVLVRNPFAVREGTTFLEGIY